MITINRLDHLHLHYDLSQDVFSKLESINLKIKKIMEGQEEIKAALDSINNSTNEIAVTTTDIATSQTNVADDLRRIKDQLAKGATPAEIKDIQTRLGASAATLTTGAASLKVVSEALKATAAETPEEEEPPVDPPVDPEEPIV